MTLHLVYELPKPVKRELKENIPQLTEEEQRIITTQIRRNSAVIHGLIKKIDLYMNLEKVPEQEVFILEIRAKLALLMQENDTFRKVLWKHFQTDNDFEEEDI
jgi:hypothetical protein